jgi:hypothetical protein
MTLPLVATRPENYAQSATGFDIPPRLKTRKSHGTEPLDWDVVGHDVICSCGANTL